VSAVRDFASPQRIKASHRRRWKGAAGRFVQRYYDPILGRFLSVDPKEADPKTGASFNRYDYANNNPYRFTDPDGRASVGEMIDDNAMQAVAQGSTARAYGWAFAATAWKAFGAEGVSQVADKGLSTSSTGDKVSAGLEVAAVLPPVKILGEAATLVKDVVGVEKVAAQGTRYAKGELREQVLAKGRQADGSVKCSYCGKPTATTSDHVVPYSKGGPTKIENLDPACASCNSSKGAKDLHTEWVPPKDRG
jgi:RHS repeat-associated protein